MKRFNSEELAAYAGIYARHHAGTPPKFYQLLKTSLNTKIKQLHNHVLTEEEMRSKAILLATKCIPYFNSIRNEGILKHLSPEITKRAKNEGVDLEAEENYFAALTKVMFKA